MQPWFVRWEQEIARKLIPARSKMFAEHLVECYPWDVDADKVCASAEVDHSDYLDVSFLSRDGIADLDDDGVELRFINIDS